MTKSLLGVVGVGLVLLACDKAPDVNAKGELRAPTPAAAAATPPAEITNGADMKNPAGSSGVVKVGIGDIKNPSGEVGVSTGLEQKNPGDFNTQKVLIGNIKGENPGAYKGSPVLGKPGAPMLTNGQKGVAR
jgi:hypothetical protein